MTFPLFLVTVNGLAPGDSASATVAAATVFRVFLVMPCPALYLKTGTDGRNLNGSVSGLQWLWSAIFPYDRIEDGHAASCAK